MMSDAKPSTRCVNSILLTAPAICFVVTFLAVPAWFIALVLVVSAFRGIDNPVALPIYFIGLTIFGLPLAFINAMLLSPLIIMPFDKRHFGIAAATVLYLLGTLGMYGWLQVIKNDMGSGSVELCYLGLFLAPPAYLGTVAYAWFSNNETFSPLERTL